MADIIVNILVNDNATPELKKIARGLKGINTEAEDAKQEFAKLGIETDDMRRAFNRLEQELEEVKRDLAKVDRSARNAGKGFGSLGRLLKSTGLAAAASATGLGYFTFEASRSAREASVLADAMGIGAGQVRGLSIAMEKVGGDIRGIRGILVTTADAVSEFEDGTGRVVEQLGKLGLTVDDFEGKDIYGQFTTIAQAVEDFGGSTAEAIGILSNLYEREDAARIAAIGTDFEDVGEAGTEALGKVAEAWDTLKEEFSKGIIAVATVTFEVISGGSTLGSSTGEPGSATGVQLPTFDPTANVINPVTGEYVSLGPLQTPSHIDPRARGALTAHDLYKGGLLDGSAYSVGARGGRGFAENTRGYLRALPSQDSDGGGGGRGGTERDLEAISQAAFEKALRLGGREAFKWAIENSNFELAEQEAKALHQLALTSAKEEETAGEQYLATLQASVELQDRLTEISDTEQKLLEEIREADLEAARELVKAREALEEINKREQAQALIDIAGAEAALIGGSQFGDQYRGQIEAEQLNYLRLVAAARFSADPAAAIEAARVFRDRNIEQINQQFLSQPLVTPEPISVGARGGSSQPQGGTLIINVSTAGSVITEGDLADTLFDVFRTRQEAGYL